MVDFLLSRYAATRAKRARAWPSTRSSWRSSPSSPIAALLFLGGEIYDILSHDRRRPSSGRRSSTEPNDGPSPTGDGPSSCRPAPRRVASTPIIWPMPASCRTTRRRWTRHCEAGLQPGPPDYVGVGTARSGTSWWDSLINAAPARLPPGQHAQGGPLLRRALGGRPARPETSSAITRCSRGPRARSAASGRRATCWMPGRRRCCDEAAPEARLLVLLRDPVERFRSGRTLAENRFTVGSTARAAANAAFNRGLYADQLLRLWRAFPREQVLVLQYERCVADAASAAGAHVRLPRPRAGHPCRPGSRTAGQREPWAEGRAEPLADRDAGAPLRAGERATRRARCRTWTCRSGRCRDAVGEHAGVAPMGDHAQAGEGAPAGERAMTLRAQTRRMLVRGSRAWHRWRGPRPPGPPDPPPCPAGWHTGPPHYVGLGAQKAGTSWWDALIGRHPSVVRASRPAQGAPLLRPGLGDALRRD